ncbi:hypothetical protein IPG36_02050 [bacterium]|nr:MAG: hypothetical protein IPG36_02050 [bacterium]
MASVASYSRGISTPPPKPARGLRVAFITTYVPNSEPIELLKQTLPAMLATHYPHDTWLLDEGNDDTARILCAQLGVRHFSRSGRQRYNQPEGQFARKTKGGNHNAWYDLYGQNYDFVAQIDTDFVPSRYFLERTLGYFQDPHVGFVGTPQIYGNTAHSLVAKGAAEQTYNFYGPLMRDYMALARHCSLAPITSFESTPSKALVTIAPTLPKIC